MQAEVTPEEFSLLRSATPEGLALANACIVAGMLEAEHQFRRIIGDRQLARLALPISSEKLHQQLTTAA